MAPEPTIGFRISWIARMLRTRFDARARVVGLTRAQWTMIVTIRLAEGATQSEVASRLEINTVTAGRIIDRLEAAGWVTRHPDPVDRRANRLYVTDKATPLLSKLEELGTEEENVSLAGFSPEEHVLLAGLLRRITKNLVSAPAPDPAPEAGVDSDEAVTAPLLG